MTWLALDIGGANLKAATGTGFASHRAFAMWREFTQLAAELRTILAESPRCTHLAVTMTGELSDCFESKTEGIQFILRAVHEASDGRHTRVYLVDGRLVAPTVALRTPLSAAASNWHALAAFSSRFATSGSALLIDIGSTTCDIIPIEEGKVVSHGQNDTDRLLSGELAYCGISRTPICSLVNEVPYRNGNCPVMRELFATTRDIYLVTGDTEEDASDTQTSDHRPATKRFARLRISRMIGADESQFNIRDAVRIAQHVTNVQIEHVARCVKQVADRLSQPVTTAILSGEGEFLARRVLAALQWDGNCVSLSQRLGTQVSKAAAAHALAVLARESVGER